MTDIEKMTREDFQYAFFEMASAAHAAQRVVEQLINAVMFLGVLNVVLIVALIWMAQR